jgi:aspartate aminotransferase
MELSERIMGIKPSATLAITSKAKAMKSKGIDVISFGAGEPDFDTPQYIKEAAKQAIDKGKTKYTLSIGTLELREAICKKLLDFNNLEYKPEDIVVSNGAKHSLYNIFQAICNKGDEVVIISPYWVSYFEMISVAGATPVVVAASWADGFKVSLDNLAAALTDKTKAIIINSPLNPAGSVYSKDELKGIFGLLKGKQIRIISDEIYERLIYDGLKCVSIASLSEESRDATIIVNGVSKTYSMTGWRIGYIASNDRALTKAIKNLQDHSTSNPSSISQEAALTALTKEDSSVEDMKKKFEKRRDYMVERIKGIDKISCVKPMGAFYCFVDMKEVNKNTLELAERLLDEAKVAVVPGEAFGTPGYIRLSFAASMENIKEGLDRIERWLKQ